MIRIDKLIIKYKYYFYASAILMNIYGVIQLNPINLFAIGWCLAILYCSLLNDEII